MSAETLRRAASLMRERAEVVRLPKYGDGVEEWSSEWLISGGFDETDAEHIASWHPAVALAIADWLDVEAELHEWEYDTTGALAVARAYLRESA